ncbi:MAG TPA: DMT family transporter [Anaeromyxobacter sp.]|nr:DMT family transporter [Anaeromyxobacter sp.]
MTGAKAPRPVPVPAPGSAGQPRGGPGARRGRAFATLALLALLWGYSWIPVKIATYDASPLALAALRSGLGALALLAFLAGTRRPLRPPPFGPTLVLGLLQTVGFTVPQTVAVSLGGAGRIAVLAYTMPLWLALLAWAFLGERPNRARLAALALAAVGLALVVGPLGTRSATAGLLGVLSGLLWAASAVWALRALLSRGYDLLSVTTWQMVWGSAVLVALALAFPGEVRWTPSLVASVAFLGIVGSAGGWALWTYILTLLPASAAGIGSLATPVVGAVAAAVQLGEIPTRVELVGMACIVVALVVNARAVRRA